MRATLFFLTIIVSYVFTHPAMSAECGKIPDNAVWGRVDNAAVGNYVRRALDGDWDAYLDKWQARLDYARELRSRNSIMILHGPGVRLTGDKLSAYIMDIEARLNVTKCLAGVPAGDGPSASAVAGAVPKDGS